MSVNHIEVLVEEPSAEAALRFLLPKMVGNASFQIYGHQCKADLLQQLPALLRGYARWLPPDWGIVVVVDKDTDECDALKARLEQMAVDARLTTRTQTGGGPYVVANRIAIEELEAWYFGDWEAVQAVYPRVSGTIPAKAKFRDTDAIAGGTWEAFERVLQRAGYFRNGLRKIEAARAIAPHMEPARNRSRSFRALREALAEMTS